MTDAAGVVVKVATYNVLKGGSQRVHWVKLLQEQSIDLLLVQETYHYDEHLPPRLFPKARRLSVWQMVKQNGWGSAVYSSSGSVQRIGVSGFKGWVVGAEITKARWQAAFCESLLAFSIHAPSEGKTYAYQVNKILDRIKRIVGQRECIIGGDFNITISDCNESERPVRRKNLQIQARLAEEFGLLNCWQAANPNQPLTQTLRWTGNRAIPYHCDGAFVPKAWKDRLASCVVLAGKDWNQLSDHNPVVASFA
jgi:exonuclease III